MEITNPQSVLDDEDDFGNDIKDYDGACLEYFAWERRPTDIEIACDIFLRSSEYSINAKKELIRSLTPTGAFRYCWRNHFYDRTHQERYSLLTMCLQEGKLQPNTMVGNWSFMYRAFVEGNGELVDLLFQHGREFTPNHQDFLSKSNQLLPQPVMEQIVARYDEYCISLPWPNTFIRREVEHLSGDVHVEPYLYPVSTEVADAFRWLDQDRNPERFLSLPPKIRFGMFKRAVEATDHGYLKFFFLNDLMDGNTPCYGPDFYTTPLIEAIRDGNEMLLAIVLAYATNIDCDLEQYHDQCIHNGFDADVMYDEICTGRLLITQHARFRKHALKVLGDEKDHQQGAYMAALYVMHTEDRLNLSENPKLELFMKFMEQLPQDLQLVLCNRLYGSARNNITDREIQDMYLLIEQMKGRDQLKGCQDR